VKVGVNFSPQTLHFLAMSFAHLGQLKTLFPQMTLDHIQELAVLFHIH
jgi:hypothetical protein